MTDLLPTGRKMKETRAALENAKKIMTDTNSKNKLSPEDERLMEGKVFSLGQRTISHNSNSIESQKETTASTHSHQASEHEDADDQDSEQDDISELSYDIYKMDCGAEDEDEIQARQEREQELEEILAASDRRIKEMWEECSEVKELKKEVEDLVEFDNFKMEQSVLSCFAYQTEKMLGFYLYNQPKSVKFSELIEISKSAPNTQLKDFGDHEKLEAMIEAVETLKKRNFAPLTIGYLQNIETEGSSELQTILSIAKKNNDADILNYTNILVKFWEKVAEGNKVFDDESWKLSHHLST